MHSLTALASLLLASLAVATPATSPKNVTELYRFSNATETELENIAVRSNGQLIVTCANMDAIFIFDPSETDIVPKTIDTWPSGYSALGITEVYPDVFAVNVGTLNSSNLTTVGPAEGTYSIWTLNFTTSDMPVAQKFIDLPQAGLLNGLTTVPGSGVIFTADQINGTIFRIDMATAEISITIDSPLLGSQPYYNDNKLALNGVRYHGQHLYVTDSSSAIFGRYRLNRDEWSWGGLELLGQIQQNGTTNYDDLAVDDAGNAYVCIHPNALSLVQPDLTQTIFYIDETEQFNTPASVAFGRGIQANDTLYVVCSGSIADDGAVVGGALYRIDLLPPSISSEVCAA
ncbi:hypothetical protein PFICI_11142 [Pestalotiopsis fici W106-1]|uniref:SMP-30/Gluconolactonase/LRE-like region domain-containing protein n=1 Tax=Pestalotiopsis fici (strain W106-1 / CGMCC3.15140) TaxID=1229662 RepID=W3WTS9_PESFW|nr:uncharacterized protein PFICI_11142 [Pestalotiopsis fici W106-1]ETS77268.1 hypothetical protein PFICI_11142 [Pestalotiopsis fici W106-1]